MNDDVFECFPEFSVQFEGRVQHMYLDVRGLVTIGVGNLIDPVAAALEVHRRFGPLVAHADGRPVDEAAVSADFARVKGDASLAARGHTAARAVARLDLPDAGIDALVAAKAREFAATLRATPEFAACRDWPGDAQLALLSMAWALGPAFGPKWPRFRAACGARDWAQAAENCTIREEGNPGIRPRNVADRTLFGNAAFVAREAPDVPDVLYFVSGARPAVKSGASGAHVEFLQGRLTALGYLAGPPSGLFDAGTDAAVRRFQGDHLLTVDGIVGAMGWAALGTVVPAT